ncbi:MAG TPA: phosphate ABC transporter substrate-binding/OmpA family protein [Pseudomonadota bacterium]|jgi:NitT/TauT family transport system substrate-binding protein|nr:phosphate ABC transporter substrate-binding/OmpA family protein [Pseudomonadota bacterium]
MKPRSSRFLMRGNSAGTAITLLLIVALIAMGAWLMMRDKKAPDAASDAPSAQTATDTPANAVVDGEAPTPIEPVDGLPTLDAAAAYAPQGGVVDVDISEYAGYAGLVVANGGLDPNPDSFFAKNYGFQVRLTLSEEESWSKLNNGKVAASVTTADVLAALGRQFEVTVPAQIGFSRGADMVVVDTGITSINQLKGKVLAASQFNESEFFIRYLASEANVPVAILRDLDARPAADQLGLVFYEDNDVACDAYEHELATGNARLNGCVGWSPRTDEVIEASAGKAKMLVSNRNLLIIADLLVVNKGFATAHPDWVKGLVHGLLDGNRRVRDEPEANIATIAKAFQWSDADTRDELSKVHLSNLPENQAFFAGTIDSAGSFNGIFQSSVLAYGKLIKNPADPARFVDAKQLDALKNKSEFAKQTIAIAPIKTRDGGSLEGDALLSKDIRFFFEPNSATLDRDAEQNLQYLDSIKNFLQVSPGSIVVLRGHVDNARMGEFEREGGQALVRSMALKAMELSRQRSQAVRDALLKKHPTLAADRIEVVGRGWEEPAGADSDLNRRVEVQWFTLE